MKPGTILLTGATGFVGTAVRAPLHAAGWKVRCLTRDVQRARRRLQDLDWVQGDLSNMADCERVLDGCAAAIYLVHSIGEGGGFGQHEVQAAQRFAQAAEHAGLQRIVYLGGVAPSGPPSVHLQSRMAVGQALRSGSVPTIELRASMIIGHGSLSWLIVRDLAARLPVMVLPSWLRTRSQPVSIEDVVAALLASLDLPLQQNEWFDLPGPNVMSAHEILDAAAHVMGLPRPRAIEVPLLSARLSSHWLRFVTRADWKVAKEIVVGLTNDLLAQDARFWALIGRSNLLSFEQAARAALLLEAQQGDVAGVWGFLERLRAKASRYQSQH